MEKINKDFKLSVRLTPNQNFELEMVSKELKIDKSKLIRLAIDDIINKWYEKENLLNF